MWIIYVLGIFILLYGYTRFVIWLGKTLQGDPNQIEYDHSTTCDRVWRVYYSSNGHMVSCPCGINPTNYQGEKQ